MGLCNIECVERVARYLDVPEKLFLDKNIVKSVQNVSSFSTTVQTLVRSSNYSSALLDNKKEIRALIQQWLEYIVICMNHADVPANAKKVLNDFVIGQANLKIKKTNASELNTVLKDLTYICGTKKTIADIVLYYVLYSVMNELNLQQKAQYVHVSRWFDNIQQEEKLRQELDLICFNLLHIFL
ncbi:eukaryotic translation elongation factor 1 epsilon-1 isoform X1 [Solenopsis invicta]|uniref:eukaryotic translation elongation factor 1 epsilon-1 isoform X1 n=1 Tax=Solenopsis invicta TaxID=13686 RepID=UPI00193D3FCB|nr:eukaryotic translation elongation factor 1 epsilon-1 isoform X1 [Solenopsis invicta]